MKLKTNIKLFALLIMAVGGKFCVGRHENIYTNFWRSWRSIDI